MIPVDMPVMLLGYMIYIFSEVFLWLFIAGLIALLVPRSRRFMVARRWRFGLLLMLLAVGSVPYIESSYRLWQDWRAHNPRLEHEEVLGDLVLPAGTRVHLQDLEPFNDLSGDPVPYGMQSLDHADFDRTPSHIMGMPVRRLKLAQAMVSLRSRPCRPMNWQDGNVSLGRSSSIFHSVLISSFPNGR